MTSNLAGGLPTPPLAYERVKSQPENPFAALIPDQSIAIVPSFTLESGVTLRNVPVAYSTRGRLAPTRDNAMVICHALTGSADVGDWWGPLLGGPGRAFDVSRFYVVCMNSLGSPYGSASPVTNKDGDATKGRYGPEFPLTTIRDDVNLHKLLLDDLGIRQVAVAVGGSMGGMLVLEWAYFGKDYVRAIVPIATSSQHSAWGISWGEAQRQSIYSDPKYQDGYYSFEDPPSAGLGAARMSALLTYRSRNSFEARFGRNAPDPRRKQNINGATRPATPSNEHWAAHNDGNKNAGCGRSPAPEPGPAADPQFSGARSSSPPAPSMPHFSAQSYLRYQGAKFVRRFDSNCYIAITRKLDTHDVSRDRPSARPGGALALLTQPALILGIESDGLFTFAEQQLLAASIPGARLATIDSPEGHDAFLLQFEQVNALILEFLRAVLPEIMGGGAGRGEADETSDEEGKEAEGGDGEGQARKNGSVVGEAEEVGDITAW
ncbi:MAG: homoserine O- acetyltransferase [Thelocarpon impressellum]|nr:MAG: homoserine O- acetyltransferase [Thelocarpon impressellum]